MDIIAPVPPGCLTASELERMMVDDLRDLRKARQAISKKYKVKDLHAYNTIAKLSDAIVKVQRALAERIQRRDDEFVVRERERRLRARDGAAH